MENTSPTEPLLNSFNKGLNTLKEEFHRTGRFDDANTKLDEIVKVLTIKFFDVQNNENQLDLDNLGNIARKHFGNKKFIAKALQEVFVKTAKKEIFFNSDGTNIFGPKPSLNLQATDDSFAITIVKTVNGINFDSIKNHNAEIDIFNEAFGHFVRDNFRNHKEDAQYMTPSEVVNAMVDIAVKDILQDPIAKKNLFSDDPESFFVLDPTCGVGSFLTSFLEQIKIVFQKESTKNSKILKIRKSHSFLAQDKVDRMVRLARINFLFAGLNPSNVHQGNSIIGNSSLDKYVGKVDLILTNPPFGAEFSWLEINDNEQRYSLLPSLLRKNRTTNYNSELLILDRAIKILKPGGRLLIVVPDGVVSAKGFYETYRNQLGKKCILKAVIDLPAVTFAQAGTRTKCSILFLQKPISPTAATQAKVFMAVAKELGYEVKERLGSPVKFYSGRNDLETISNAYSRSKQSPNTKVVSENPSIVNYLFKELINGKWNANFYSSNRINTINNFSKIKPGQLQIKRLEELASFESKKRERSYASEKTKYISVLHINEDSTIKINEVIGYKPIGPGNLCFPGEIIFSKINPRIPRIAVVPDIGYQLICSNEFEILRPIEKKNAYLLKSLLLSKVAQDQILSLTSGTSSSHNRIKDSELKSVKVIWPKKGSPVEKKLILLALTIARTEREKYKASEISREAFQEIESLSRF